MRAFSPISEARLKSVHPKLAACAHRALQTCKYDFMVAQGVRTVEEAYTNFGKGRTGIQCLAGGCPAHYAQPKLAKVTFLHHALSSNHLPKADGLGYAIDLLPEPYDWKDREHFVAVWEAMMAAAKAENVHLVWGGSWKETPDLPHFELHP